MSKRRNIIDKPTRIEISVGESDVLVTLYKFDEVAMETVSQRHVIDNIYMLDNLIEAAYERPNPDCSSVVAAARGVCGHRNYAFAHDEKLTLNDDDKVF